MARIVPNKASGDLPLSGGTGYDSTHCSEYFRQVIRLLPLLAGVQLRIF